MDNLVRDAGQIWGYVSWAALDESGGYTGKWLMISPGANYVGDNWLFIGPNELPFSVPPGRVRLNAFNRRVYLGTCVDAVVEALSFISGELAEGHVRPIGEAASNRRGADMVMEGVLEALVSNTPPSRESGSTE